EIYDYEKERRPLEAAGHAFRGASHAELLLHGFEQDGPKFLQHLSGHFAAAIWDDRQRRLTLISDRFGMKPLYYFAGSGTLLFASEIKALLCAGDVPRQMNLRGLAQFFTFGQL